MGYRVTLNTVDCVTFFTGIGQTSQYSLRVICYKHLVIHVELFDRITTLSSEALSYH